MAACKRSVLCKPLHDMRTAWNHHLERNVVSQHIGQMGYTAKIYLTRLVHLSCAGAEHASGRAFRPASMAARTSPLVTMPCGPVGCTASAGTPAERR